VIAGAFRFTTSSQARKRDIAIKVKNVSIGIRGTDLWGKSTDERDLVCLIEGKHRRRQRRPSARDARPAAGFLPTPRDGAPRWRRSTEAARGLGRRDRDSRGRRAARAGGRWRVVAAVFATGTRRSPSTACCAPRLSRRVAAAEANSASRSRAGERGRARSLMGNLRGIPGVTLPHVQGGPRAELPRPRRSISMSRPHGETAVGADS
jgi:hypothetical protein